MSLNAWHNARAMYERDACAQAMGMDIVEMDEGYAVVTMTITPQMLNGHNTCHGGQLFRWQTPPLPTPATARGWRRSPLAARLIFCVRALPGIRSPPPRG